MAANVRDVISVNATFVGIELLPTEEAVQGFRDGLDTEVSSSVAAAMAAAVVASAEPGIAGQARVLSIDKDRISLTLSSDRSIIQRDYPVVNDLPLLARVTGAAIANTDMSSAKPRAFGYNIQLVFSQDSERFARKYLSTRIFPKDYPRNSDWHLRDGSAKLNYQDDGGKLWTATIEPRFNDPNTPHVFLSLNMHIGEPRMPDTPEIAEHLETLWASAVSFVQSVDRGGDS